MAGVQIEAGGSKRRSLDAQVNMIPMIDLLVAMIAFLLITAVWTSVGQVQARQPTHSSSSPTPPPPEEPQLRIAVSPSGLRVGHNAVDMQDIAPGRDQLTRLRAKLADFRRANAGEREVWIEPDSAVNYNEIIRVMDTVYDAWGRSGRPLSESVTVRLM